MGAYLSAPDTRKESEGGECRDGFTYGCSSMQGWRRSQEDAHIACDLPDGTTVFGVFDGHGGREVSAFAKRHFGKVLASQPQFSSDLPASLIGSFHRIDEMLEDKDNLPEVRALKKDPRVPADEGADASSSADKDAADDEGASGATSVVAAVRGRTLFVANAGDSRAILSRRGKAIPLSTDHKPALSSELARITSAGGFVTAQGRVNGNLNLSRALGDLKYKVDKARGRHEQIITAHPDVTTHTIEKGDEFMVLACDGVWDCMTNQQVVDFVRERIRSTPLPEICEQILDHCIADDPKTTGGIGGDNMTCIIVNLAVPTEKGPPIWTR